MSNALRWRPRPHATVRGRLIVLLLLAALPVLVLALAGAHALWRASLAEAEHRLARDAAIAQALTLAAVSAEGGRLHGLALALAAQPGACEALRQAVGGPGGGLRVLRADGTARCGPAVAGEAAAMPPDDAPRLSAGSGAAIRILRAVPPAAAKLGMVVADVTVVAPGPDTLVWLLDAAGRARPLGAARALPASPLPVPGEAALPLGDPGAELLVATAALAPGLTLVVAQDALRIRHHAAAIALRHLAEIGALLAVAAAAVVLGARYAVTRPLARLRAAVRGWHGRTAPPAIPPSTDMPEELRDLAETFRAGAAALAAREAELRAAMDRAELLAAEVHHRVKNNLQIVSSLLALQGSRLTDPVARAEFEAARDRVGALATLHRHLYVHHEPDAIDLGAFLHDLGGQLFASVGEMPGRRIALEVEAPKLRLASDRAVPLALVITEALSAALKQGFPPGRGGRVAIRVAAGDGRAEVTVEDDGAQPRAEDPLRAMLIRGLARQLGGELLAEPGCVRLRMPLGPGQG